MDTLRQEKTVDKRSRVCYTIQELKEFAPYRGIEQLEARRAHNPEAGGSSPPPATKKEHPSIRMGVLFYAGKEDENLSKSRKSGGFLLQP